MLEGPCRGKQRYCRHNWSICCGQKSLGVPFTINLVSSKLVGNDIEYGLREFSWSGKEAEKFNAITRAYYLRAAKPASPLPESMDLAPDPAELSGLYFLLYPEKKKSKAQIVELENGSKLSAPHWVAPIFPACYGRCRAGRTDA